ncbi:uncharacterized protein LOC105255145 [Camponotus floridanus]|uniref:uncharacterized protein LOC105255145 n=1 Tax=Camponotus floridanus TaxID=104421 RepID=UPI000DC6A06F|nr:uncharacterized protein LOC105255145 [Camponotus floridanus]
MLAVAVLVKIFTFYFNKQKIKDLTDRLFMNWDMLENQEEREIMRKYTKTGKWYALIYAFYVHIAGYIYIGLMLFASIALIPRILDIVFPLNTSRPIELVYPAYYFVNEEKYFYYIFCHMIISAELSLTGVVATDSMLFVYMEHLCGLFAVIGFRFEHMLYKYNNVKKLMINRSDDMYCKNVMFAVHVHREALQFAILLENTFSLSFGIQMLIAVVGMSISLVQFTMQLHDFGEAMRYMLFIGGQLIHLFCYSFQGQKLINHSTGICDKIYNGSWYEIPITAQRLLLMVMRKGIEASTFTAGKIYVFSLANFTAVKRSLFHVPSQRISYQSYKVSLIDLAVLKTQCLLKTMDATWNYYYNFVYKISSLVGLWPFLKPRTRIFRVTVFTITSFTAFIPQIAFQFTCKEDLRCTFKASTSYLYTILIMLKMYTFQLNINTMKDLTRHLFVDWKKAENPEEYKIMKLYAQNSRRFSLLYLIYCSMGIFIFVSISLIPFVLDIVSPLNQSRPVLLPYPGYYFVDIREYFLQIFWHSLVAWQILTTGIIAHDCMYVTFVEHICSMFSVIGYTKLLEDTFNMPFAAQMLIVTVGMSLTLLQLSRQDSNLLDLIRYMLYVIGQLIHLFILNFEGQKLIDHSVQTRDRIYNSAWYKASIKSQKLFMLVMMKCLRPSVISAGRIYIFSLESFSMVLQTSMSYFTVLASFQ